MKYILATILVLLTAFATFAQEGVVFGIDRGMGIEMHEFNKHDGNLHISYTIHLDGRAISRWHGMSLTPAITDGNTEILLPSFVVLGPNKGRVLTRYYHNRRLEMPHFDVNWRTDNSVTYSIVIPSQAWMENAQLVILREIQATRARSVFDYFVLNNRVELERPAELRRRVEFEPRAVHQIELLRVEVVMPAREEREQVVRRQMQHYQTFLHFPVGQTAVQPNYRNNPVILGSSQEVIHTIISNPDAQLESIYLRGYASPEGTAAFNERLSAARATVLQNHLRNTFNIPLEVFSVSAGGEDWDGLVRLLNENRVFVPNRDRILHIIATEPNPDRREQRIRALDANAWTIMLRHLFPELRRVDYRINYSITQTVEDAHLGDLRNLSHYEMFQIAERYGRGTDRAAQVIKNLIVQHFPDDELAHNNAAALYIQRGDLAMARAHLARAGDSSAALNNRGVLALLEGNLERAEHYLARAQAAGSEDAVHNRNELHLKRGGN